MMMIMMMLDFFFLNREGKKTSSTFLPELESVSPDKSVKNSRRTNITKEAIWQNKICRLRG